MSLLAQVREIVREAGKAVLKHYGSKAAVQKADASPLTEADRASHLFLLRALADLAPRYPVVSEEGDPSLLERSPEGAFWLVDPLDGTKEFLKETGEFTVNVALVKERKAVLGVVHAPALDLIYSAEESSGAWRAEGSQHETRIRTRTADPRNLCIVTSRDHAGPEERHFIDQHNGAQVAGIGSSLKFCLLAEGKADLYPRFGPTMEWDTAAAQCVLESAGGQVRQLGGEPLHYCKAGFRNPRFLAVGDPTWQRR